MYIIQMQIYTKGGNSQEKMHLTSDGQYIHISKATLQTYMYKWHNSQERV